MALEKTLKNRPDLLDKIALSEEEREILDELRFLQENPES
jgi:tRNA (guanine37-N1)-methyltransferase